MAIQKRNISGGGSYELAGGESVLEGDIIVQNSGGYAEVADSSSPSDRIGLGIATEAVDNTDGSSGDLRVPVEEGEFLLSFSPTVALSDGTAWVYAVDRDTASTTGFTTRPLIGYLIEFKNSSRSWVCIKVGLNAINRVEGF